MASTYYRSIVKVFGDCGISRHKCSMGIWETRYQTLLWRWFDLYVAIMITIIIYYNTILIKIKLAAVNDNFSNNDK